MNAPSAQSGSLAVAGRPAPAQLLRATLGALAAAALALTVPLVDHIGLYLLVLVLFGLVATPAWIAWHRRRLDPFEPVHFIGAISFVYFGLGSLWTVWSPSDIAFDVHAVVWVPLALLYCVIGFAALLIGYYGPWRGRRQDRRFEERLNGNLLLVGTGAVGLVGYLMIGLSQRAADLGGGGAGALGSLSQLYPLFLFAWALSWMLVFRGEATPFQRLLLFGVFAPGAAVTAYLTFSNKSIVMTLVGMPLVCFFYARGRLPWRLIVALVLVLIFVVFPFYNTFRTTNSSMAQADRLQMTYRTVSSWEFDRYWELSLVKFKSRMALINSVAVVIRDTGRWVPYAGGSTIFAPAAAFFVPRVLWPDKPSFASGREFGVRFRLVNHVDRHTHIAPTVPGELYWNFDLLGIVIGMGLWGAAMRLIYRAFGEASSLDPVRRAVYVTVLVQLAYFNEGNIAGHGVTIVRTLILLTLIRWMARHWNLLRMERVSP